MIRPRGVKSLAEIRDLQYPEDRVPAYATLLEMILRDLGVAQGRDLSLNELIELHSECFRDVRRVYFANMVRNDLVHALGGFSTAEWAQADRILDEAVLTLIEDLPPEVRVEIWGASAETCLPRFVRRIEFSELIESGNLVWPGEVAFSDSFTQEASNRFFSHFMDLTFSFELPVKSIYIHRAKERLPKYSCVDGFLHSRTVQEIKTRGHWPDPIGDIRLECGGNLAEPIVTVSSRLG